MRNLLIAILAVVLAAPAFSAAELRHVPVQIANKRAAEGQAAVQYLKAMNDYVASFDLSALKEKSEKVNEAQREESVRQTGGVRDYSNGSNEYGEMWSLAQTIKGRFFHHVIRKKAKAPNPEEVAEAELAFARFCALADKLGIKKGG